MWMKVDDGLHAHRKTRAVTKSHPEKRRDASPMGLWVLAGSWAAERRTEGWVPRDELDRWDDEWDALVDRLVQAGYWWPASRDGEPGYGFTDWHDYNDPADLASKSGTFGNHVRWHVNEKRVDPDCAHCPKEPADHPEIGGDVPPASGGDRGAMGDILRRHGTDQTERTAETGKPTQDRPESGGESRRPSGAIALPVPEPVPEPDPSPSKSSCASADAEREFDAWYAAYPRKRGKGQAAKAYRAARKKASGEALLAAIEQQAAALIARGVDYCPYPATWLNGERWNDQPDADLPPPQTRVQEHLTLVQQLAAEEAATIHEIGQRR